MKSNKGKIYFVGAGPGDQELITVRGLKALQKAEVIIYDRLVHPSLLLEAKHNAKLIYCGKQPCKHTLRQSDIQKELIIQAKKGNKVVRLKGGDPAVFGRVGEEAEAVSGHRIPYEIIPGITAGSAASIYSGVPLTHREYSRSFAVVTGHSKNKDGKPDIAWGDLAKGVDTIVFYMGIKNLPYIAKQLIKEGKDRSTSTLVTEWGTYGRQRSITGPLEHIPAMAEKKEMSNPAVIVVGDVTKLHDSLQWVREKELSGKGVITLSSDNTDQDFADDLKEAGAEVYNIKAEDCHLSNNMAEIINRLITEGHATSVLLRTETSASLLCKMLEDVKEQTADALPELSFICIGSKTAQMIKEHGYVPNAILRVLSNTETIIEALGEKQIQNIG